MSDPRQPPEGSAPSPPVSTFASPVDGLIRNGNLSAPAHPGLLASLDRFEILRLTGAGGMGLVFQARDAETSAIVAIKLLRPELAANELAVRRFLKEARHMQRLQHPNILKVLEIAERPAGPYFVMPFIPGGSLVKQMEPAQPLDCERTLLIARQIAEALLFAHSKGIIHRDLKPGNILLDENGHAWLTDFGLARTLFNDSIVTLAPSQREGTVPYMSPAVAAGQAEDTRCDIYSFGAVLYEMLTGQAPYQGTDKEILQRILDGPPKPILHVNGKAPPALAAIAETAMAREHRDRYASMEDVAADIERSQKGLPVHGRRGTASAAWGWRCLLERCRRPALAAASLAIIGGVWLLLAQRPYLTVDRKTVLAQVEDWSRAHLGHWDTDGVPDFFLRQDSSIWDRGGSWMVVSGGGQIFGPYRLDEPRTTGVDLSLVADVTGDGVDEAFISWANGPRCQLAAFNAKKFAVKRFQLDGAVFDHGQFKDNHTGVHAILMADADGDGNTELFARATTPWGRAPCGLYCFALKDEVLKWKHLTDPHPSGLVFLDLDQDGRTEVVFGSYAANSPVCYLHALTADGKLLWRYEAGPTYTGITPLIVTLNSGGQRLFAWSGGRMDGLEAGLQPRPGYVIAVDPKGQEQARYNAQTQLESCLAADLNRDGNAEILATDRQGFLHLLTPDLALVKKVPVSPRKYSSVDCSLIAVTNLTRHAGMQVVLLSSHREVIGYEGTGTDRSQINQRTFHESSLIVLDEALKPGGHYPLAERLTRDIPISVKVADMNGDGVPEIVVLGREVTVLRYRD